MTDNDSVNEVNEINSATGIEQHNGIPESTFQNLFNTSSGLDFVNQFANSGLTLAQAEAAITPAQAQAILGKFGSDSNFQAFLHGQTPPPVTVVGVVNHEAPHVGQGIYHLG